MTAWVLQGNPDLFDIDGYVTKYDEIVWRTPQSFREIAVGDTVYFWRAAGKKSGVSGIIAEGEVVESPTLREDDPRAFDFWKQRPKTSTEWRVVVRLRERAESAKRVVKKEALINDPLVRNMGVIRFPNATVFKLSGDEANRLAALWKNTGRGWTREEAVAALWAYDETYGKPVSKLTGSPVVEVALRLGRAVNSAYDKLMNFRGLDPRDERKGFAAGADVDRQVWEEFYDAAAGRLRSEALERGLVNLPPAPALVVVAPEYEDFGSAPKDDPEELQTFARRVRRGQQKLRKKLLKIYDHRCAISGHGPDAVLEAAHVAPHAETGINHPSNAILLRADLHSLFDDGFVRIRPDDLVVEIDLSLAGTPYADLAGRRVADRKDRSVLSVEALRKRYGGPRKVGEDG